MKTQNIVPYVVVLIALIVIGGLINRGSSGTAPGVQATYNSHDEPIAAKTPDPAAQACYYARTRADTAFGETDKQASFDLIVSALHYAARCDDDEVRIAGRGLLLSMKALKEYELHSGDPETDFNEANMLLEKCITDPRWYGTRKAAQVPDDAAHEYQTSNRDGGNGGGDLNP